MVVCMTFRHEKTCGTISVITLYFLFTIFRRDFRDTEDYASRGQDQSRPADRDGTGKPGREEGLGTREGLRGGGHRVASCFVIKLTFCFLTNYVA